MASAVSVESQESLTASTTHTFTSVSVTEGHPD